MRLDPLLRFLAVASVVCLLVVSGLVAAVASGVLLDDGPRATSRPVTGPDGGSYRVPDGPDWTTTDEQVSYRDADGTAYATGQAPSWFHGDRCLRDGRPTPGAWAVLLPPTAAADPATHAARSVVRWARGYGTGEPVSEPVVRRLAGDRLRADVRIDLAGAEGECLGRSAQVAVVVAPDDGRVTGLVVARQVGVPGGLAEEEFEAVVGSFR